MGSLEMIRFFFIFTTAIVLWADSSWAIRFPFFGGDDDLGPVEENTRREEQRTTEKVDCRRVDEFITVKDLKVDGQTLRRYVPKKESYIRCLKQPKEN